MTDACFFIITPSYNQAEYLSKSIDSVLSQTKVKVKLAVFDGGSTDNSRQILQQYSKKIFWVSQKDKGQTDAINQGISWIQKQSKEKNVQYFFTYLNADDYYLNPEVLYEVAETFAVHPDKKWLVGDARIVNSQEKEIQHIVRMYKFFFRHGFQGKSLSILNPFPQPSTFFRLSAIEEIGLFNEKLRYTMDYEYWLRAYKKFGNPILLKKQLSAFRIHKLSKGGSSFKEQFQEEFQVAKDQGVSGFELDLHELHAWLTVAAYRFLK